ncbi:hypothetical protein HOY82DRAFT_154317 [Tuber indicum]|nr:hypothetical protein HOY82DRAFT_154317 [Tuber indicum]
MIPVLASLSSVLAISDLSNRITHTPIRYDTVWTPPQLDHYKSLASRPTVPVCPWTHTRCCYQCFTVYPVTGALIDYRVAQYTAHRG